MNTSRNKEEEKWYFARMVGFVLLCLFVISMLGLLIGCDNSQSNYKVVVTASFEKEYNFYSREDAENFMRDKLSNDYVRTNGYIEKVTFTHSYIVDPKEESENGN